MALRELQLKISGMTCNGCARTVTGELKRLDGMMNVDVNPGAGLAQVRYDDSRISLDQLKHSLDDTGAYSVTEIIEQP